VARAETGATDSSSSPRASREHAHDDGTRDVRIGAFAGLGFPRPLSVEGMLKIGDTVGLGLEYSLMPETTIASVDTKFNAIAADLRVFPFKDGFFVGMSAGHQHLGAVGSQTVAQVGTFSGQVTADTWFVNPRIGFLKTWGWGLTLGIDAGLQIPVSATITNTIPSELALSQSANDVATTLGKSVLPTVDLLRIGLLL
jgi:hypothetical protein